MARPANARIQAVDQLTESGRYALELDISEPPEHGSVHGHRGADQYPGFLVGVRPLPGVADADHSISPDPVERVAKPQRGTPTRQHEATADQAISQNLPA
jgi:hypothetical protein